jgi:tRNA (adenine-N(1)-)-methyltransferase non-catalytic subunit
MAPPPPTRTTPTPVIPGEAWEGCSVLLDINDGDRLAFFRLTPGASVPSPSLPLRSGNPSWC